MLQRIFTFVQSFNVHWKNICWFQTIFPKRLLIRRRSGLRCWQNNKGKGFIPGVVMLNKTCLMATSSPEAHTYPECFRKNLDEICSQNSGVSYDQESTVSQQAFLPIIIYRINSRVHRFYDVGKIKGGLLFRGYITIVLFLSSRCIRQDSTFEYQHLDGWGTFKITTGESYQWVECYILR